MMNTKKLLFFLTGIVLSVAIFSCVKSDSDDCQVVNPTKQYAAIDSFCKANGMNYQFDSTYLVAYEILDSGTGQPPKLDSIIVVNFTASLLNGTVISDTYRSDSTYKGYLNQYYVFPAWCVVLPKINKGGHVRIVSPSAWAYGCSNFSNMPRNSIVQFDVHLLDVNE